MKADFPSDRRTLEAIVSETTTAERVVAARLATVRSIELVGRQARSPVFRGPAAQAHLASEFARLRAAHTNDPPPALLASGPHLTLPDARLPAAEYLAALHHELISLHRAAMAALAEIAVEIGNTPVDPAPARKSKAPRNQGKGRAGFEHLKNEWRAGRDAPSYSELKRRHGWKSLEPSYAAFDMFYEWEDYKAHVEECPKDHWGPGPRPLGKRRR